MKMTSESYIKFIRNRINELAELTNISHYDLSLSLGHNKGYIGKIVRGEVNPSLVEFFKICEELKVEPEDFFNPRIKSSDIPVLTTTIVHLKKLRTSDIELTLTNINRLLEDY